MLKKSVALLLTAVLCLAAAVPAFAEPVQAQAVTLSPNAVSHSVSSHLYGVSLQDAGYAVEGGLNANLVRNNSFEYLHGKNRELSGWSFDGQYIRKVGNGIHKNNPSYIFMPDAKDRVVRNIGFYTGEAEPANTETKKKGAMGIQAGEAYAMGIWFCNTQTTVSAYLANARGEKLSDTVTFRVETGDWAKYNVTLTAAKTDGGILTLEFDRGDVTFDFLTLIPKKSFGFSADAWKYTALRQDLYEALAALQPGFLQFAGGCTMETKTLSTLPSWKDTVGPPETRKQYPNPQATQERDYNNSFSLGYHEYFQLCEELSAVPVPVIHAGMVCQKESDYDEQYAKYQSGALSEADWQEYLDTIALRPGTAQWDAYVQDVLDLIAYMTDEPSGAWGEQRAANGHPAPFSMPYLQIGSDNWGAVYFRNFEALKTAVQAVYPDVQLIASAGSAANETAFSEAWERAASWSGDVWVAESDFRTDSGYLSNTDHYDNYSRSGAKVFLNGYGAAVQNAGNQPIHSNLQAALAEAAYMTGLEKNSEVVKMASPTPIISALNADGTLCNAVWFTPRQTVLTPSYYTQLLFMHNTGTEYVKSTLPVGNEGVFQSVTVDAQQNILYVKLVNTTGEKKSFSYDVSQFGTVRYVDMQSISNRSPAAYNDLRRTTVIPSETKVLVEDAPVLEAKPYSVNVLRIAYGSNTKGDGIYRLPKMPDPSAYYTPLEYGLSIGVPIGGVLVASVTIAAVYWHKKKKV